VTDILIAGGGPAGLAVAIRCVLAGLSVTVAEPREFPVDKACGEGLMPAAVERLAALGVRPAGHPLRGIRYVDPRHRADAVFRGRGGLGVRRTALHDALADRAAKLEIPVLPGRVTGFAQDAAGVTVSVAGRPSAGGARAARGTEEAREIGEARGAGQDDRSGADNADRLGDVRVRYLVGADGLHSGVRRRCGLDPVAAPARRARLAPPPRFGLRRHYRIAPWTDLVEVHWAAGAEAYVTPVAADQVGIAVLGARGGGAQGSGIQDGGIQDGGAQGRGFDARLAAFPLLRERLAGAVPVSGVRGAGPLRQDVRCRVAGRVLLAGDASGYQDALTGEGIGAALAQAEVLAACLAAGRPGDYERAWRRVTRLSRMLTGGLLWSRHQPLLAPRIVPAAQRLPWLFGAIVNQVGRA
jgi:flavin-dependent dehydrogenase